MIRLLLVDDEPVILKGLRMRLAAEPDVTIIGEATDGESALALAATFLPDIVLMDLQMPRMDGIVVTKALHAICPNTAVIILTIHDDAAARARAGDMGVSAFITKQASMDELLAAIRETASKRGQNSG
jgi:DNA-binding NarL/FixJ family response regulator